MTTRLPWQRDGKGGFIAYPEGEEFKDRRIHLTKDNPSGKHPWKWWISYDKAKRSGSAATQQEGADRSAEAKRKPTTKPYAPSFSAWPPRAICRWMCSASKRAHPSG